MPRAHPALPLAALLLAGCAVTPENYAQRFAEQDCEIERRCFPDDYALAWEDQDTCIEEEAARLQEGLDWAEEACAPDWDQATACWRAIEHLSCEEIAANPEIEACDDWMGCF
ncbi:MAG: hypothetical protein ABIO70_10140 [Pseudomonadota bacterium]